MALIPLFLGPLAVGCSPVQWERDYQEGLRKAATQRRRALLQFYNAVNQDCRQMDAEVFADPEVQEVLHNYVAIRVDAVLSRDLAREFNVQIVPTFIILRPDWVPSASHAGGMGADEFRLWLIKHSYD